MTLVANFVGRGIATPQTPAMVVYYLGEAQKCEDAGASAAGAAMYRAALEAILTDQGCTKQMLGPKIGELKDAIAAKSAPLWAMDLTDDEIGVLNDIKDVGNSAVHMPADIAKASLLDENALRLVRWLVANILDSVYEAPARKAAAAASLAALRANLR